MTLWRIFLCTVYAIDLQRASGTEKTFLIGTEIMQGHGRTMKTQLAFNDQFPSFRWAPTNLQPETAKSGDFPHQNRFAKQKTTFTLSPVYRLCMQLPICMHAKYQPFVPEIIELTHKS